MAHPIVYIAADESTGPKFGAIFAKSCGATIIEKHPGQASKEHPAGTPWAGFGSPQTWDTLVQAIKSKSPWYYGDHAYFGRGKFYRVTKNAFQHSGIGEPDFDRLKPFHIKAQPWQKGGEKIIVCPQSENFHERMGEKDWLENTLAKLKLYSDRKIIVRRKGDSRPLAQDLKYAHCLVTHTSNAAVEALLAGVPVICTGDCPASRLSLSDPINVEYPFYPDDRLTFAAVLAANQWTLDEIAAGKCWEKIR